MKYIVLDLETIPHRDAGDWLEPVTPDARLVDPEKIAKSIADKTAERDEKLGLDPDLCQIVALGYHVIGRSDPVCEVTQDEQAERGAIERLAVELRKDDATKIVTFYGRQFDLPVLMRRAMYLGVSFPKLNLDRYRSPHIDVWDALTYSGALRTAHSLAFYAKRMGFTTLDKVNGADVAKLAKAGDWEAIRQHCLSDVGLTHSLANRLGLLTL